MNRQLVRHPVKRDSEDNYHNRLLREEIYKLKKQVRQLKEFIDKDLDSIKQIVRMI